MRPEGGRGIEGRIVESWVMGKEKSDTPQKRAGTAYLKPMGAIDRRARHMTTVKRLGLTVGRHQIKGLLRKAR